MTESEARALCARRRAAQPQFGWLVQRRASDDWVVARVPLGPRVAPGSLRADRGAPIDAADDPRPANFRNVPPFGGGGN